MAFGVATVMTCVSKGYMADKLTSTPAIYSTTSCVWRWGAIGKGATGATRTASCADTALTCEMNNARTCGTESTTTTASCNDTYQNVGTFTATSASSSGSQAVDEAGLFTATSSGGGGMMASATFNVVNLSPGDSLQNTWKIQFA